MIKPIKYLWVYSAADEWTVAWHTRLLERRKALGYDVVGFCNTPVEMGRRWLHFDELDERWRKGEKTLLQMYEGLARALEGRDVLVLYNGANLHPDFVRSMDILKVYTAGDDPESTDVLTKPLAPYFDIHLVNNIACIDMYRGWGLKHVHFWPLGSLTTIDELIDLDENGIGNLASRSEKIVFFGGYQSYRRDRFDMLTAEFPNAFCAGSGWPRGRISWQSMWAKYRQAQIGWNFHNSTGPINFRTYELPAYGVMEICDNKSNLAKLFEIGKEVVGFDTTKECIDATRYYLAHTNEQRDIAVAGWRRWKQDYHPDRVWERLIEIVEAYLGDAIPSCEGTVGPRRVLATQRRRTILPRLNATAGKFLEHAQAKSKIVARRICGKA